MAIFYVTLAMLAASNLVIEDNTIVQTMSMCGIQSVPPSNADPKSNVQTLTVLTYHYLGVQKQPYGSPTTSLTSTKTALEPRRYIPTKGLEEKNRKKTSDEINRSNVSQANTPKGNLNNSQQNADIENESIEQMVIIDRRNKTLEHFNKSNATTISTAEGTTQQGSRKTNNRRRRKSAAADSPSRFTLESLSEELNLNCSCSVNVTGNLSIYVISLDPQSPPQDARFRVPKPNLHVALSSFAIDSEDLPLVGSVEPASEMEIRIENKKSTQPYSLIIAIHGPASSYIRCPYTLLEKTDNDTGVQTTDSPQPAPTDIASTTPRSNDVTKPEDESTLFIVGVILCVIGGILLVAACLTWRSVRRRRRRQKRKGDIGMRKSAVDNYEEISDTEVQSFSQKEKHSTNTPNNEYNRTQQVSRGESSGASASDGSAGKRDKRSPSEVSLKIIPSIVDRDNVGLDKNNLNAITVSPENETIYSDGEEDVYELEEGGYDYTCFDGQQDGRGKEEGNIEEEEMLYEDIPEQNERKHMWHNRPRIPTPFLLSERLGPKPCKFFGNLLEKNPAKTLDAEAGDNESHLDRNGRSLSLQTGKRPVLFNSFSSPPHALKRWNADGQAYNPSGVDQEMVFDTEGIKEGDEYSHLNRTCRSHSANDQMMTVYGYPGILKNHSVGTAAVDPLLAVSTALVSHSDGNVTSATYTGTGVSNTPDPHVRIDEGAGEPDSSDLEEHIYEMYEGNGVSVVRKISSRLEKNPYKDKPMQLRPVTDTLADLDDNIYSLASADDPRGHESKQSLLTVEPTSGDNCNYMMTGSGVTLDEASDQAAKVDSFQGQMINSIPLITETAKPGQTPDDFENAFPEHEQHVKNLTGGVDLETPDESSKEQCSEGKDSQEKCSQKAHDPGKYIQDNVTHKNDDLKMDSQEICSVTGENKEMDSQEYISQENDNKENDSEYTTRPENDLQLEPPCSEEPRSSDQIHEVLQDQPSEKAEILTTSQDVKGLDLPQSPVDSKDGGQISGGIPQCLPAGNWVSFQGEDFYVVKNELYTQSSINNT
ncbi:uncharacterized protein LOC101860671 [Aplysia californica]|uniref:Uncharacterized protein LOC101860671 n=1 Tax=Aplysia californica TaxID=6500 RepID=A0ABM0JXW9_APLCA|nr:uncharacterized protein LOC101860671 [Aplysia californica]